MTLIQKRLRHASRVSRSLRAAGMGIALSFALSPLIAVAQERVAIPGTTVSVVAAPGFKVTNQFSGLIDEQRRASVLIVEFPPVAYGEISQLFKDLETVKGNFARQQVTIEKLEEIDTPAGRVPLASGTQTAGGLIIDKWIALYKGEKTVLITVQAPQASKLGADTAKGMLQSIALGAAPKIGEKIAGLPFTIEIADPYRPIDTLGGLGLLLTVGPLDQDPTDAQASIIVVYQSSAPSDLSNVEAASEALLKQTKGYATAKISEKNALQFAGVNGFVTRGTYTGNAGDRHFVHYLGVSPRNSFIRMIAAGTEQQMAELKPALENIVASIKLKAP